MNNSMQYYEKGARPEDRKIVDHHRARINDWIDRTTNPARRDYVSTNAAHAVSVFQELRDEAHAAIAEHRQKQVESIKERIDRNRKTSRELRQPNPNRERNYQLKMRLASDEELQKRLAPIRNAQGAAELMLSFNDSEELAAYLDEVSRRPKLKSAMDVVSDTFRKSGADPTDLDRPDVLFDVDRKRQLESEDPGTVRVTLFDDAGEERGSMPVQIDKLIEKDKLEQAFKIKLK